MDPLTQLAVAARDGDRGALDDFIHRTHPEVRRLTAHLVGQDRADDVAQETYIRVLRALPRFRAEASARTWLLTICRAACADAVRTSTRQRRLLDRVHHHRPATQAPDPSGHLVAEHLVGELDDERRAAFVLTQMLGLSYDEAAEVCGVAVGTIRSRVARARAQLIDDLSPGLRNRRRTGGHPSVRRAAGGRGDAAGQSS